MKKSIGNILTTLFLSNTQPGEVERLLSLNFLPTTVESWVNAYLFKTGDKLILIDAGTAGNFGPTLGQLTKSLAGAGYTPDQINAVLITHAHVDHVGGLMVKSAKGYISLQKRLQMMIMGTAKDRFEHFIKHYSNLYNRIPKAFIASYLDISRETLSRLYKS